METRDIDAVIADIADRLHIDTPRPIVHLRPSATEAQLAA